MKVRDCDCLPQFLLELHRLIAINSITGMAVMLVREDGLHTTHQYGLETDDLAIAARLFAKYVEVRI